MDAQLKQKWIEALRSGEYQQTHGKLRDETGYCCLGVLCTVAEVELSVDGMRVVVGGYEDAGYSHIESIIGLSCHPLFNRNDGNSSFKRHNFPEIADYIEANIPDDGVALVAADLSPVGGEK